MKVFNNKDFKKESAIKSIDSISKLPYKNPDFLKFFSGKQGISKEYLGLFKEMLNLSKSSFFKEISNNDFVQISSKKQEFFFKNRFNEIGKTRDITSKIFVDNKKGKSSFINFKITPSKENNFDVSYFSFKRMPNNQKIYTCGGEIFENDNFLSLKNTVVKQNDKMSSESTFEYVKNGKSFSESLSTTSKDKFLFDYLENLVGFRNRVLEKCPNSVLHVNDLFSIGFVNETIEKVPQTFAGFGTQVEEVFCQ